MDDLKTGDLLLFCGHETGMLKYFSWFIKICTHSNYSHVAMVIKDPDFVEPNLKGIYLWESGWEGKKDPQDGKIKLGVQLTPLQEIINNFGKSIIIVRKIHCKPDSFSSENLQKIHNVVYDKPYDIVPKDWIEALTKKDPDPQKISRFWCSALVGYIYTKCGILDSKTDWTIMRPSDFSVDGQNLNYINGNYLDNSETRIH